MLLELQEQLILHQLVSFEDLLDINLLSCSVFFDQTETETFFFIFFLQIFISHFDKELANSVFKALVILCLPTNTAKADNKNLNDTKNQ